MGAGDSRETSSIDWRKLEPARNEFERSVIVSGSCLLKEFSRLPMRRPTQIRGPK